MSFLANIFGRTSGRERLAPLYRAIVAAARDPFWYREGEVPDTIDGRFDMIAALLALALLRLEAEGERGRADTTLLTELFIDDMEGSVRQLGTGDLMVGKQIGRMMGALGGRLAALRSALDRGEDFSGFAERNIFHESPPSAAAAAVVGTRLNAFYDRLLATPAETIIAGAMPTP